MLDFLKKQDVFLDVEVMMCEKCAARVKKVLEAVRGVTAEVDLAGKCVKAVAPAALDPQTLAKAVTEAGYPAKVRAAQ